MHLQRSSRARLCPSYSCMNEIFSQYIHTRSVHSCALSLFIPLGADRNFIISMQQSVTSEARCRLPRLALSVCGRVGDHRRRISCRHLRSAEVSQVRVYTHARARKYRINGIVRNPGNSRYTLEGCCMGRLREGRKIYF